MEPFSETIDKSLSCLYQMHYQLIIVVALVEHQGRILIMRRYDPKHPAWHHRWEFPGGKIEPGETPSLALHREIKEETKLSVHSEKLLGVHTHHWNTPKGVQQTFLLLHHCYSDSKDVVINPHENDQFLWETPKEILKRGDLLEGNKEMFEKLFFSLQS